MDSGGAENGRHRHLRVAIPFVFTEGVDSPNIAGSATLDPAAAYVRAISACFASLRRWNPDLALSLVTNRTPPEGLLAELAELGVEVDVIPFSHRPPSGYVDTFVTSFFLLDAIEHAVPDDTLFLDPDIVCIDTIRLKVPTSVASPCGLPMSFKGDENVNGLTINQAIELHTLLGEKPASYVHYGGEAVFVPKSSQPALVDRIGKAWQLSLERHQQGKSKFTTEEHIISYAFRSLDVGDLSPMARRIWTASVYRTVDGSEGALTLWHLPAEKGRGFDALYEHSLDRAGWFWTADRPEFIRRTGQVMGLHSRPLKRVVRDTVGRTAARLHLR